MKSSLPLQEEEISYLKCFQKSKYLFLQSWKSQENTVSVPGQECESL